MKISALLLVASLAVNAALFAVFAFKSSSAPGADSMALVATAILLPAFSVIAPSVDATLPFTVKLSSPPDAEATRVTSPTAVTPPLPITSGLWAVRATDPPELIGWEPLAVAPVLLMITAPGPLWVMETMVNGEALLVRMISPLLLLLAEKALT